jgi:hypothetical protein
VCRPRGDGVSAQPAFFMPDSRGALFLYQAVALLALSELAMFGQLRVLAPRLLRSAYHL